MKGSQIHIQIKTKDIADLDNDDEKQFQHKSTEANKVSTAPKIEIRSLPRKRTAMDFMKELDLDPVDDEDMLEEIEEEMLKARAAWSAVVSLDNKNRTRSGGLLLVLNHGESISKDMNVTAEDKDEDDDEVSNGDLCRLVTMLGTTYSSEDHGDVLRSLSMPVTAHASTSRTVTSMADKNGMKQMVEAHIGSVSEVGGDRDKDGDRDRDEDVNKDMNVAGRSELTEEAFTGWYVRLLFSDNASDKLYDDDSDRDSDSDGEIEVDGDCPEDVSRGMKAGAREGAGGREDKEEKVKEKERLKEEAYEESKKTVSSTLSSRDPVSGVTSSGVSDGGVCVPSTSIAGGGGGDGGSSSRSKSVPGFGPGFGVFGCGGLKSSEGSWKCGACMVSNGRDVARCVCCNGAGPSSVSSSVAPAPAVRSLFAVAGGAADPAGVSGISLGGFTFGTNSGSGSGVTSSGTSAVGGVSGISPGGFTFGTSSGAGSGSGSGTTSSGTGAVGIVSGISPGGFTFAGAGSTTASSDSDGNSVT